MSINDIDMLLVLLACSEIGISCYLNRGDTIQSFSEVFP